MRYLLQRPLLAVLNILSVAIGVAVFLAVQLANESANNSFRATVDFIAGKADLEISGAGSDVPDDLLPQVSRQRGVAGATPIVRGLVTLPDFPGEYLDVVGLDIFTNAPFRTFELSNVDANSFDSISWLRDRNAIAVSQSFATEHHLVRGDPIRARVDGATRDLTLATILQSTSGQMPDSHFGAMDIGWAQELFGKRGRLDAIQVRTRPDANRDEVAAALKPFLPPNVHVASPQRRSEQIQKIVGSFQLNLTALSLVALFVGVFLIYNTTSASVVRRRHELGVLRSLGVSAAQVKALFISEALLLAIAGTLIGIVLGNVLARSLVSAVSHTISALYVAVSIRHISAGAATYLAATAVGLVSGICAAWMPARAAASADIGSALRPDVDSAARYPLWRSNSIAAALIICAALSSWLALTIAPPWFGFGAAFFTLSGFSFLAPAALRSFVALIGIGRPMFARRLLSFRIASDHLLRAISRNAVTVAALASAVAMTVGITVMVFSFRRTVDSWIDQTLVADVFIAPASNEITGPVSFVPREVIASLEADERVAIVDTFRQQRVLARGEPVLLAATRGSGTRQFPFVRGSGPELMNRFREESCVIVSESFARHHRVAEGGMLPIETQSGVVKMPIVGVFYDYTRDEGVVYTSMKTYAKMFSDERVNSVAIYLKQGVSGKDFADAFHAKFAEAGEFAIYQNRELRKRAFEVFDQTFAVTYVLQAVAVVVAVTGTFLAFTTLVAERARVLAIMRAVGMSTAQLTRLLLIEAGMIGVVAGGLGVVAGLALAVVLTVVINRAFFGWTVQLSIPWGSLASTPLWVIASAVVAAIVPAWLAGRSKVGDALRFE